MIASLIEDYIDSKVSLLNERYDTDIKAMQTDFITEFERIPANQSNNYYQVMIENVHVSDDYESDVMCSAVVNINFSFFTGAKKYNDYKVYINRYLWNLINILRMNNESYSNEDITTGVIIREINSISLINANTIQGTYFKPVIELGIVFLVQSNLDIITRN